MNEIKCGRIGANSVLDISQRVAMVIAEHGKPLAVCLAPSGHVTVESPRHALESDLVGVYRQPAANDPVATFHALLNEDILTAVEERKIRGGVGRRHIADSRSVPGARYIGEPCKVCRETERYASSHQCCKCSNVRRRERLRAKRAKVAA
ncbi:hypothetical protein [Dyella caseinilytica]|uniref:Uncharacterized protein n=1 Tax=Dyella caseinilytica TaxID=1849581 RepID=A0ABX7GT30_9GAMM|nr:hypothetical protein [Dyella caseinilytica]QRN52430.1 hypothetical protein ISN74_13185 [Dyella caseinilytica]GGA05930.1 hypothetical protein GCM10011408_28580 [Dyella caseinilytica]